MVARTTTTTQPAAPSPASPAHPTKIKQLLEAVSKQQPFAAVTRPEQAARWRLVHNAVWKDSPAAFDVQSKFTMLMAIPASNQRTFADWDDEMYELYDELALYNRPRTGSVRATARGHATAAPPPPATETDHANLHHTTTPVDAEAHDDDQDDTTTRSASTMAEEAGETDQRDTAAARPAPTDTYAARGQDDDAPRPRRAPPTSADSERHPKRRRTCRDAESKEEADEDEDEDDDDDDKDPGDKAKAETVEPTHDYNLARAILEFEPHKDQTNNAWMRVIGRLRDQGYPRKLTIAGLKLQFGKFLRALMKAASHDEPAREMRMLLEQYSKSEGVQSTRAMQELVCASQQPGDRCSRSARATYDEADAGAVPGDHGRDDTRRRAKAMRARARSEDAVTRLSRVEVMSGDVTNEMAMIKDAAEKGVDKDILLGLLTYRERSMNPTLVREPVDGDAPEF